MTVDFIRLKSGSNKIRLERYPTSIPEILYCLKKLGDNISAARLEDMLKGNTSEHMMIEVPAVYNDFTHKVVADLEGKDFCLVNPTTYDPYVRKICHVTMNATA
ncbi:MAG: hypothetical protein ABIF85_00555 [Nanoarchaeota archaeon]|nr:hypothetical protein [Nanoarchaeota archaeon]MBU4451814.1 hypothetical protein [Nanoarchaeota archaeon]MCG2723457.1 hypothetical protein [archaeon]